MCGSMCPYALNAYSLIVLLAHPYLSTALVNMCTRERSHNKILHVYQLSKFHRNLSYSRSTHLLQPRSNSRATATITDECSTYNQEYVDEKKTQVSRSEIQHERSCYIWIQTFVLTTLR